MPRVTTHRGVVLHSIKYGESSMVVYVLTREQGRMSFMLQGVGGGGKRRNTSFLQPMFPISFIAVSIAKAELERIREIDLTFPLKNVPYNITKSTIAIFMAETIYRLVREVEKNVALYDFIEESIRELDGIEDGVANFHLWFLVRIASFLGFHPSNEYINGCYLDIVDGNFSIIRPKHNLVLSPPISQILNMMSTIKSTELGSVRLSRRERSDFLEGLLAYLGYHLDTVHNIKSISILREVF